MGKLKDYLLEKEYKKEMTKENTNLKEYLLTIDSKFQGEPYEQDNYYLVKYNILDLMSLEPITISEKVKQDQLEQEIPKQLAVIIHESNYYVNIYDRMSYKSLINNGWLDDQYIFEAIPLKESINSLNDLVILPSTEKAIIQYLDLISNTLNSIDRELYEIRADTQDNLNNINKALDLMNHLTQS